MSRWNPSTESSYKYEIGCIAARTSNDILYHTDTGMRIDNSYFVRYTTIMVRDCIDANWRQ